MVWICLTRLAFNRFSINWTCCWTDQNCDKNFWFESAWLDWNSIDTLLIETENFQFLSFWPNFFFHASFMFRIHMHCIVFCIHLAVLQSYLSLFSHIACIHFAKLGTQLDLKIDWLIFESFVHFSICYFYVWTAENIFLKRYDG